MIARVSAAARLAGAAMFLLLGFLLTFLLIWLAFLVVGLPAAVAILFFIFVWPVVRQRRPQG